MIRLCDGRAGFPFAGCAAMLAGWSVLRRGRAAAGRVSRGDSAMPATQGMRDWVTAVFGVALPVSAGDGAGTDGRDAARDPQEIYDEARTAIASRVETLARAMKASGHPMLASVAEFGLLGLTDGQHVALTKALLAYRAASGAEARAAAATDVRAAVGSYRQRLQWGAFTELEDNPFGIDV